MAINKRKKNSRLRGSKTHGGGAMKKRRGAGNRGGRGLAGTGKRGDGKKPSVWKNKEYFGKKGFTSINKKTVSAINLSKIEELYDSWKQKGLVDKELDLGKMGYQKLLGSGSLTKKITIKVDAASEKAVAKAEEAGAKVVLNDQA